MSAQPDHAPIPPHTPAPAPAAEAPAELLAQLRADRRATRWVPAFEQEWATALEESRRTYSLAALPEHAQQTGWDLLDAAANPWGFTQWDTGDPDGEDVRIASAGQLSVIYWINRSLHHLSVLDIVWLG
ncbi:DUF6247 family protein [Streptomyces sp. SP2-10]|nr:DUF6247 family protein [Streptomyces sp. SP2-10]MBY8847111.1 DUF6247 family protein [Streptomyces sp. SP2-10]